MVGQRREFRMNSKRVIFDYYEAWCHMLDDKGDKLSEIKFDLANILGCNDSKFNLGGLSSSQSCQRGRNKGTETAEYTTHTS
jgi:hypothetical protein